VSSRSGETTAVADATDGGLHERALVLVCAWCGVDLEREAAARRRLPRGLSHGICRDCYHRVSVAVPRRAVNGSGGDR
jgi:hypothetical protein